VPSGLVLGVLACIAGAGLAGCWSDIRPPTPPPGILGGQVAISGGVRGAQVSVDQLSLQTGEIRYHVGDAISDDTGRFEMEAGIRNGILRITARGGSYEDLATGATIQLDDADELVSLTWFTLLDVRDDALVSPIGHLVEARTMERLLVLGDMAEAFEESKKSLHGHFGGVDWGAVRLWPLDQHAISPTEPVRAAFVHAALSVLARDIAADTGAGPQAVNVFRLMQQWTEDIRSGPFEGNDEDSRLPNSGLQLGFCPPIDPGCAVPDVGCTIGRCRRLCDLYSGTPRALLAAAMVKVISDSGPGGLNQTGLGLSDTLPFIEAVSRNADPSLFSASCIEPLVFDRLPPSLRFDPPTPGAAAFVRGTIQVKAVALDDLDPAPDTSLVGYVDQDGDPGNSVALATIDTTTLAEGPQLVVARAVDRTGSTATLERALTVDNTAPSVVLDSTGFLVDGATWWTASAAPVLTGVIADAAPVSIKAVILGGSDVDGVVSGTTWTIALSQGALDVTGTPVQIAATDAAGNQRTVTQRLRPDIDPPALSFQPSTVNDEGNEGVTFLLDQSPVHGHIGSPVDLSTAAGCPTLTKFSYLLGSTGPEYAFEYPGPNPIRYQLVTDDPGVGIAAGATEYRVGRRVGVMQTSWVLDWTSAGNGLPIGAGVTGFLVGIFSDVVPGLDTTQGIYDVEFRATDRLGRTTTVARCFDLHLRTPPIKIEPTDPSVPTKVHAYALDSLSLAEGATFDQIAARLLNNDATGASLIDQDIFNGTTATIYLTVTVTPPISVMATQSFVLGNAETQVTQCSMNCPGNAVGGPSHTPSPIATEATSLRFPAKVFELIGGVPTTEIPCLAPCPSSGTVFKFAIPPRPSGGQPARAFRVMTMIGQVSNLWPYDLTYPASPPFEDTAITWTSSNNATTTTRFTGIVDRGTDSNRTGCVYGTPTCTHRGTLVPYRALRSASLTFSGTTGTIYMTSATIDLDPAPAGERQRPAHLSWATSESVLP
jgi:hypothetical protein